IFGRAVLSCHPIVVLLSSINVIEMVTLKKGAWRSGHKLLQWKKMKREATVVTSPNKGVYDE
ncbi:MAG: hypothetical protein RR572_07990, partial [Raoultibacter sp.]